MRVDNLDRSQIEDLLRRVRNLENATPLSHASIGANGLRVYDGGMITIENGGLVVAGTAEIIGRLIATGQVFLVGEVVISGPLDVSGPVDVSGIMTVLNDLVIASGGKFTAGSAEILPDGSATFAGMKISKEGKITSGSAVINPDGSVVFGTFKIGTDGKVEINADVTIKSGGKIKAGGLTIDPTLFGGSVQFENGGYLSGTVSGPQLTGPAGNSFVFAQDGKAGVQAAQIDLTAGDRVQVNGEFRAGSNIKFVNLPTTTQKPNLWADPANGKLYKSTATLT